jgi:hypothetical protein
LFSWYFLGESLCGQFYFLFSPANSLFSKNTTPKRQTQGNKKFTHAAALTPADNAHILPHFC